MACYFFAIKWEFDKMGTHFQKNSEIAANSKHFPSFFWKKLNVFLCNFFAIKWEFDKMGTFFRISCYFGAKWEPILSRAYCIWVCSHTKQTHNIHCFCAKRTLRPTDQKDPGDRSCPPSFLPGNNHFLRAASWGPDSVAAAR